MIRYVVTTYPGRGGANLSKLGQWGNQPHTSVPAAEDAARRDAGAAPFTIDHERGKPRRTGA